MEGNFEPARERFSPVTSDSGDCDSQANPCFEAQEVEN